MGKFRKIETPLKGVYILEPTVFEDHRGFFMESYNKRDFEELGLYFNFVQDNHSLSVHAGVLKRASFSTKS
jgi:dTDP-4-dehydrorhamnose 3,5-epimerase (EC 5.1.3.13)